LSVADFVVDTLHLNAATVQDESSNAGRFDIAVP
jgi:hypothetical protein